jgi:hypothetical protein
MEGFFSCWCRSVLQYGGRRAVDICLCAVSGQKKRDSLFFDVTACVVLVVLSIPYHSGIAQPNLEILGCGRGFRQSTTSAFAHIVWYGGMVVPYHTTIPYYLRTSYACTTIPYSTTSTIPPPPRSSRNTLFSRLCVVKLTYSTAYLPCATTPWSSHVE